MNLPIKHPTQSPSLKWVFQTAGRTLAFGFGSGLSPIAPGTAGTLWAWGVFYIGQYLFSSQDWLGIIALSFVVGCWVCGQVSEELGKKDFGGIVWDEIVAFWLVLVVIMPTEIWLQTIAFILFRFFDAIKPGPIGMIDRYFKTQESTQTSGTYSLRANVWQGFGIMVDDLTAAFFTLLLIALGQTLLK